MYKIRYRQEVYVCLSVYSEYILVIFNWVQSLCQPALSHLSQWLQVPFRETEIEQLRFSHADELHVLQRQRNASLPEQLLTVAYLYEKKLQVVIVKVKKYPPIQEYEGFADPAQFRRWE